MGGVRYTGEDFFSMPSKLIFSSDLQLFFLKIGQFYVSCASCVGMDVAAPRLVAGACPGACAGAGSCAVKRAFDVFLGGGIFSRSATHLFCAQTREKYPPVIERKQTLY